MTNKEKYKQAFSVLQPSGKISLEEERMIIMKKKAKFQAAVAAAAICLAFVSGGGIVYAADLGGVDPALGPGRPDRCGHRIQCKRKLRPVV